MLKTSNFLISNKSKSLLSQPKLLAEGGLFEQMKNTILGKKYELSLAFVEAKEIKLLNKIYRNIDKATDILSFPLFTNSGEILICPSETKKMMREFDRTYNNFISYLFIHGLVHLKGYDHGPKMEEIEEKFCKKFKI